jgi:hypothetical protein
MSIIALKIVLKNGKVMKREFFSESNIGISLQRGFSTETLETTEGHKSLENVTLELNSLIKIRVETQEQENLPTKQILPLNTEKVELQEPNDKHDLKNIKKFKTELGVAQELQKVTTNKGKGKGKGQSNFQKEIFSRPKYISDNKPEGLKQEPRWKEEDKKITRSAVASKRALEKWRRVLKKSKEVQAKKTLETNTYVIEHEIVRKGTNQNESRSAVASKRALEKWRRVLNKSKDVQARKTLETNTYVIEHEIVRKGTNHNE